MQSEDPIIQWLLKGDPAIRWQVHRDLLKSDNDVIRQEQSLVEKSEWGTSLLALQEPTGQWGGGLYNPKWISTTYTLLLLFRMGLPRNNIQAQKAGHLLLNQGLYQDGGINYFKSLNHSETCVTGLVLSLTSYFIPEDKRIVQLVDFLLDQQMLDGGWNCQSFRGATHSSFHTTISVLEGLHVFQKTFPDKRPAITQSRQKGQEFLLIHKLFRSHRTGRIVRPTFTYFSFPPRWYYDILRGLDYFQSSNTKRDPRLQDAIDIVHKRQLPNGRWKLQNKHPGRTFFEMEKVSEPSRWNTLRALRVLNWWENA